MTQGSMSSYESMGGQTAQIRLKDENYAIVTDSEDNTIDIDFDRGIIRIYSDRHWKVHSMDSNSRTQPVTVLEKS